MKANKAQAFFAIVVLALGMWKFENPFHTNPEPNTRVAPPISAQEELLPKERLLPTEEAGFSVEPTALPQTSGVALSIPNRLSSEDSAGFQGFVASVMDGKHNVIRGVYVPGVLALPIVQQPARDASYVSDKLGTVTEFRKAHENHVVGLLAHNFLSGALFFGLERGQEVRIIYGDGSYERYRITQVYQFQKTSPNSLRSNFIDLSDGKVYSTPEVFAKFYQGERHVTFQTCLEGDGIANWGLLFVTAEPLNENLFK